MGHIRLGKLPQTRKWREVVSLLQSDAPVHDVAAATAEAVRSVLGKADKDSLFLAITTLLVELPLIARGPNYLSDLEAMGIDAPDSVPALLSGIANRIDDLAYQSGHRSDLGEIAQFALLSALSAEFDRSLPGLFEPQPSEIRQALGRLSGGDRFAGFAREFFAQVVHRTFDYYLSRELSNHVGPDRRFSSDADRRAFDRALEAHARQASRIVEAYAGGWYGKTVWQGGGPTPEKIRNFASYSLTKLRSELARREDAA